MEARNSTKKSEKPAATSSAIEIEFPDWSGMDDLPRGLPRTLHSGYANSIHCKPADEPCGSVNKPQRNASLNSFSERMVEKHHKTRITRGDPTISAIWLFVFSLHWFLASQ